MKPTMRHQIEELERTLKIEQDGIEKLRREYSEVRTQRDHLKLKIEDLERDKAWLKQMHSAVLQSMQEFVKGGR